MRMRWENRTGEYWHSTYEGANHTLNTRSIRVGQAILSWACSPRPFDMRTLAPTHTRDRDRLGKHEMGQAMEIPERWGGSRYTRNKKGKHRTDSAVSEYHLITSSTKDIL